MLPKPEEPSAVELLMGLWVVCMGRCFGLDWIGWIFSEASRVPAPGGDVLLEGFRVCVEYQ